MYCFQETNFKIVVITLTTFKSGAQKRIHEKNKIHRTIIIEYLLMHTVPVVPHCVTRYGYTYVIELSSLW